MKICQRCYTPHWGRRHKFCSDTCQIASRKAYQQAYQKQYKRRKQIRTPADYQRTRLRRAMKRHGIEA